MFFRNLTFFRFPQSFAGLFPSPVADELVEIEQALAEHRLRPAGPMELATRGFVSPFGRDCEQLSHACGRATWVTLGGEDKILPAAVVNDELAKRVHAFEQHEGRKPGGRTRKRMKEEVVAELLPRAFVKPGRCDAYFDFERSLLVVDTSARGRAEQVVSEIRNAVGSFPALPANAEVAPRSVLTGWLAGDTLPDGLSLGEECELRGADSNGPRVTIRNLELNSDEVAKHLEAGLLCTRLALVLEDYVSFVLGEDLVVRKLKFLDGAVEALDGQEHEDIRAELDARFALQVGELGRLFDILEAAFNLTPVEDDGSVKPAAQRAPRKSRADAPPPRRGYRSAKDAGIDTVTISGPGFEPITMSHAEFMSAPARIKQFNTAWGLVRASGNASISRLQRQMKLGYNAAWRLIEQMQQLGAVSAPDAAGKRTVNVDWMPGR